MSEAVPRSHAGRFSHPRHGPACAISACWSVMEKRRHATGTDRPPGWCPDGSSHFAAASHKASLQATAAKAGLEWYLEV